MDEWTGSAFVWRYCTRPKIAPMMQKAMPTYIRVTPVTPPRASKLTCESREY